MTPEMGKSWEKDCQGRNIKRTSTDQMRLLVIWATPGAWATSMTRRVTKTMMAWLETAISEASWVTGTARVKVAFHWGWMLRVGPGEDSGGKKSSVVAAVFLAGAVAGGSAEARQARNIS